MKLEIKKIDANDMEFRLIDSDPSFSNALRRAILREVPVMAIDEVEFVANDSAMYDEIIAHRLALVPLRTPVKGYSLPEECNCREGRCPKCSVTLTLEREGPATVKSGDLKSSDEDVVPASNDIHLLKLEKGQRLEFTAIARMGSGKQHAKWQPAIVSYKYMPVLKFNEKECDACNSCVEACPRNILSLGDGKIKVSDIEECTLCRACEEVCRKEAIKVNYDASKFLFRIESTGAMPPEQLLSKAIDVLEEKCKEFAKHIKKL